MYEVGSSIWGSRNEALASGRMKCDRFVVTALPRQWHALAFLQNPKFTSFSS
jgi:hypothetical protein